jgi:predicted amidohydrolase
MCLAEATPVIPRTAISQAPYLRDLEQCLARILAQMREARRLGADVLILPEWPLGLNPVEPLPNRHTERLAAAARDLSLMLVAGSVRTLDPTTGRKAQHAFILDCDGRLAGSQPKCEFHPPERPWFEPGDGIRPIATRFGRFALLQGPDAVSEARWRECREGRADVVVMAAGARTQRERAHLEETAVARSREWGALVLVASMSGRFSGTPYVGGAAAAHEGRLLATSGDAEAGVVLASPHSAPLIQLGVTDAAAWTAVRTPPPGVGMPEPEPPDAPEAERRVLVDWGLLRDEDLVPGARQLLAGAGESPRAVALAPAVPGRTRELRQLLSEGARGAFAWPALAGIPLDHPQWLDIADVLAAAGRPLLLAMQPGPFALRLADPLGADDLLRAYPALTVVLLGTGAHARWAADALLLARLRANVWLDTSAAPPAFVEGALAAIGPERVVFASGLAGSFTAAWTALDRWRQDTAADEPALAQITGTNARRLFFGETPPGRSHPGVVPVHQAF